MSHTDHEERISLYVDNRLSDNESASLFAHLSVCNECRTFMRINMRVRSRISTEELADVPGTLDQRIRESIAHFQPLIQRTAWYSPIWFTKISIPLPAAASIVFLLIVGSLLFSPLLAPDQQRRTELPKELLSKVPSALQRAF